MAKTAAGACLLLAVAARGDADGPRTYLVDSARSTVAIQVGRGGLFSFAGHTHEVLAPRFTGEVQADVERVASSSVNLSFESAALQVSGRGEPPDDVPKVQARMVGPELLDVARFPSVTFRSTRVEGRETGKDDYELRVTGDLTLHGVKREVALPMRVTVSGDELRATGSFVLRQTEYGLKPVSVAGVVKVKDELSIDFAIVATTWQPPPGPKPQAH